MADYDSLIFITLHNEGGYSNRPSDPGGPTNMGITQKDLDRWRPGMNVKDLTTADAIEFYKTPVPPEPPYWLPIFDQITSQHVASKIFDMRVLFGKEEAVILLQQVTLQHVDGVFGPQTLNIVNQTDENLLLSLYKTRLSQHARNIMASKPAEIVSLQGWLNRIAS